MLHIHQTSILESMKGWISSQISVFILDNDKIDLCLEKKCRDIVLVELF